MAIQQGVAPVAKPTGGNGHDGHRSRRDDCRNGRDNHKSWNQQSTPLTINSNNSHNFQAHSAAAQSQGTQQQPQKSSNTGSTPNANPNNNSSSMQMISNVRFLAVTIPGHMPGENVTHFYLSP